MDSFLPRYEKLVRENEQLKLENTQLKSTLQSITNSMLEEITIPVGSSQLMKSSSMREATLDEKQFKVGLAERESQPRTSSPVDFKTLMESSGYVDPSEDAGFQSAASLGGKESERLLGEITYQLDRRILSYVFQSNKRFYGFNLHNIPSKIVEVSTHPLTGIVDEDYRVHLTQRYDNIKDMLTQLGYKIALHPTFSEFVVNSYGILLGRPKEGSSVALDYQNPEYLKSVVVTTAPVKLHKDLILLLNCLCSLAGKDCKPLLLW